MRPCTARPTHPLITCTGRAGAAATRPPPAAATTRQDAGASDHSHRARRAGPTPGPIRVDDAGMPTATMITEPERHTLAMPEDCDCGMCTPAWARRKGKSRRYTEPVTLATALHRETAAARTAMVAQHCACLAALVTAAGRVIEAEPPDDLGTPEIGLPLVLFAGELAAALQPDQFRSDLPADLVQACEQTITTATLAAAGCLSGLAGAIQTLSALAG
jgi:hypothetical protein